MIVNARPTVNINKISLMLLLVLALNVLPATVALSVLICIGYIIRNIQILTRVRNADLGFLSQLAIPLMMMMALGVAVGMAHHNALYDVFKDAYFFFKVIVYIIFSFVFFQRNETSRIINTFAWFGIGVSVIYVLLLIAFIASGTVDVSTVDRYRKTIPDIPYDPLLSIILLLFIIPRAGVLGKNRILLSTIQSIVIVSTLSRLSFLILFTIYAMFVKSRLRMSKGLFILPSIIGIAGLTALILIAAPVKSDKSVGGQLLFKITNIFNETLSSSFKDRQAIIENWRAYEAMRGVAKFAIGTPAEKLTGYGFGALTDIGFEIKLGGVVRTNIPIFHNGYIFILVKLGVAGLILYLIFVYRIYYLQKKFIRTVRKSYAYPRMLTGDELSVGILIFFLVAITSVFFGIFNNAIFNNIVILLMMLLMLLKSRTVIHQNRSFI